MNIPDKSTKKLSENKQIFLKSLFYILSVHLLANGINFAWSRRTISPMWLVSLIVIFLVSVPTYFFLKSNIKKTWRYLANMSMVHGALCAFELIIIFILYAMNFFKGFEWLFWFFNAIIIFCGIGLILLIDLFFIIYIQVTKGKK